MNDKRKSSKSRSPTSLEFSKIWSRAEVPSQLSLRGRMGNSGDSSRTSIMDQTEKTEEEDDNNFRPRRNPLRRAPAFHSRKELNRIFEVTGVGNEIEEENLESPEAEETEVFECGSVGRIPERIEDDDDNDNLVFCDDKRCPHHGTDKRMDKYIKLRPESIVPKEPVQVYDIFGHLKKYFYGSAGLPERKILISFPEEIVKQAEIHGDRAGKDREVTRSKRIRHRKQKIRKIYDKKRKRAIIDPEIREDLDSSTENAGCFEGFVQHYIFSICGGEGEVYDKSVNQGGSKLTLKYRKASTRFGVNLDQAGDFLDGLMRSVRNLEAQFSFKIESEVTENLNAVCAELWLCTYAIHHLFQTTEGNDAMPSRSDFEDLVRRLERMATNAEQLADNAIVFAPVFCEFGKEVLSTLARAGKSISVKLDTSLAKPVKLRDGLQILKAKDQKDQKEKDAVPLKVVARSKVGIKPKWENFSQFPTDFQIGILKEVTTRANHALHNLDSHLRFISDDIVAGKFDEVDPPFATILILLHDLLRYFVVSKETTKIHLDNLTEVFTQLMVDTRDFCVRMQGVLLRIVEIRDMTQLCFDYLNHEYSLDIKAILPNTQPFITQKQNRGCRACCTCCTCKSKRKRQKYKVEDFMHTQFRDALVLEWITIGTTQLLLKTAEEEDLEEKGKDRVEVRFSARDLEASGETHESAEINPIDVTHAVNTFSGSDEEDKKELNASPSTHKINKQSDGNEAESGPPSPQLKLAVSTTWVPAHPLTPILKGRINPTEDPKPQQERPRELSKGAIRPLNIAQAPVVEPSLTKVKPLAKTPSQIRVQKGTAPPANPPPANAPPANPPPANPPPEKKDK